MCCNYCCKHISLIALLGPLVFFRNSHKKKKKNSHIIGALHLTAAVVSIAGQPSFFFNTAQAGSGGAVYCGSVPEIFVKNAVFVGNRAVWGGAVAMFSSGAPASTSSSTSTEASPSSGSDEENLTPSLAVSEIATSPGGRGGTGSDYSVEETPVKFRWCQFSDNYASEDGGGICESFVIPFAPRSPPWEEGKTRRLCVVSLLWLCRCDDGCSGVNSGDGC